MVQVEPNRTAIGIELRCAEKWRDYPYMDVVAKELLNLGFNVYVFDLEYGLRINGINNIVGQSLRTVMQYIANMDLMICPDSGLMHIAGALDVPMLAIVAPTDFATRLQSYNNVVGVDFDCKDYPCWYNPCKGQNSYQPCLSQIKPKIIVNKVREVVQI